MSEQNSPSFDEPLIAAKPPLDKAVGNLSPEQVVALKGVADSYLAVAELVHRRERGQ